MRSMALNVLGEFLMTIKQHGHYEVYQSPQLEDAAKTKMGEKIHGHTSFRGLVLVILY